MILVVSPTIAPNVTERYTGRMKMDDAYLILMTVSIYMSMTVILCNRGEYMNRRRRRKK